jgi:hypothetical protein
VAPWTLADFPFLIAANWVNPVSGWSTVQRRGSERRRQSIWRTFVDTGGDYAERLYKLGADSVLEGLGKELDRLNGK